MKKNLKVSILIMLVGVLAIGTVSFGMTRSFGGAYTNMMGGYSHGNMMSGYDQTNRVNGYDQDYMMGGYDTASLTPFDVTTLKSEEALTELVERYIGQYDQALEIEDIFIFSNSDYYYSIIESETGKGALELLVNPVSGTIYPEFGPNMMWNTEYGMHGNNGFGMMGMMRGFNNNYDEEDALSKAEALEKATTYLEKTDDKLAVEDGGHGFYGYYTFHVLEDDNTIGMMSVNEYTGDVWYHSWHGELIKLISENH